MKTYQKLGTVLALTLGSAAANATVLYNNLPANPGIVEEGIGLFGDGFIANKFSTSTLCPSGCILGNVTLNMAGDGSSVGYQLSIASDNAGSPGTTLATLKTPDAFTTFIDNNVFTPIQNYTLAANSSYWVKLTSTGSNSLTYWDYLTNPTQTVANQPSQAVWNVAGNPGTFTGSSALLMKVEATSIGAVSHVPVPGSVWLMGSALLGLATSWRKKSKSSITV